MFHVVATRHYTWEPGTTINVVFMDGKVENMQTVANVAKEWTKHANIDFAFFRPGQNIPQGPQLRVSFQRPGYWSLIGSQAAYRDRSIPTMNLNFRLFRKGAREIQRVVLHEFGHSLGLWHEHQNPNATFTWNKPAVYEYYKRTHGWSEATVDSNLFNRLDADSVNATEFDPRSIMVYSFPRNCFLWCWCLLPRYFLDKYFLCLCIAFRWRGFLGRFARIVEPFHEQLVAERENDGADEQPDDA